ncbi:hypothetical protein L2089_15650 [Paenibacillus hunanensis]|nr:hypothetical protein [Paenibacillus hunanensis]MCL9662128.1 hypothetical protein [Paenibacillus hunanensis]
MATKLETPVLNLEESKPILEELKRIPTSDQLKRLREQYNNVNAGVGRGR